MPATRRWSDDWTCQRQDDGKLMISPNGALANVYNPPALLYLGSISRRFAAICSGAAVISAVLVTPAFAGVIMPEPGVSPNAESAQQLYLLVFGIGLFAITVFLAALAIVVLRSRRNSTESDATTVDPGNGGFRRTLTAAVGVAILLMAVAISQFTTAESPSPSLAGAAVVKPVSDSDPANPALGLRTPRDRKAPRGSALSVYANGQQYLWRFGYSGATDFSYHTLVVPVNTTVLLNVTSSDVIHSLWIPGLVGRVDAVPGYVNKSWFRASRIGTFDGSSTTLSGPNYANMTATVKVVSAAQFKVWLAAQSLALKAAKIKLQASNVFRNRIKSLASKPPTPTGPVGKQVTPTPAGPDGKKIFVDSGCGACHALSAAGTSGAIGPNLDAVGSKPAKLNLESIVDPNAVVGKGYTAGIMPLTFGKSLSPAELDALVEFLMQAKK